MFVLFPSRRIAFEVFGWPVHWYGLLYVAGFLLSFVIAQRVQKYRDVYLSRDQWSEILSVIVLGVVGGGRLGYVLFYAPGYYLQHPLEILAIWQGGMSSHGGFIGVILGLVYLSRKLPVSFFALGDIVIIGVAVSLALGRVGNFINQELYGTVTGLPWGIVVPGVEGLRHPTQMYAVIKDLFIAGTCYWHIRAARPARPGSTAAIFLMLYAALRFLLEFLRVQEYAPVDLGILTLTRGQFLSLGILAFGAWVWSYSRRTR